MNNEELLQAIRHIMSMAESDMDRLPSSWDEIRIEAFEQIHELIYGTRQ